MLRLLNHFGGDVPGYMMFTYCAWFSSPLLYLAPVVSILERKARDMTDLNCVYNINVTSSSSKHTTGRDQPT